jgi:phospholipid N-methyltransferase
VKKPNYIRQYLGDKDVGALHPSSRFLVRRLIGCLRPESIRTLVELGPGPGVSTRPILEVIPESARYVAIEKNPAFLASLRAAVPDPRLTAVEGDARAAGEILSSLDVTAADAVIASIPFSFLKKDERDAVLETVASILSDEGDFVIFHQFSLMMRAPLKKRFPCVEVLFEPRNVFPCFLLHCRKRPRPPRRLSG